MVNSDSPEFTLDSTLFTFSGLLACDSLLTFENKMRSQRKDSSHRESFELRSDVISNWSVPSPE